jgi:hypothetical protein
MEGFRYNMHDDERGIVPRAVEDIFRYIQSCEDEDVISYLIKDNLHGQSFVHSDLQ